MEPWKLELMHSGSPGMHWYIRRFQNYDGSLTPEGRKRYGVGDPRQPAKEKEKKKTWKEKQAEKKRAKQRKEALDKARQAKIAKAEETKRQAQLAANKERVLTSGKASEIMQYQGQLSNKELNDALSRIRMERELSSFSAQEKKSNWEKADSFMNKVDKLGKYMQVGTRFYNSAALIANTFLDDDTKLPIVGAQKKKDKDK